MRFASSIGSSKNLWTYQGFFLVVLKFYTFGSWFHHNHWIEVLLLYTFSSHLIINVGSEFAIKSEFLLSWVYFQYRCWVLIGISIEVRIIWYQSLGSKIRFIILLPFVSCYHPILFRLCSLFLVFVLYRAPSSKKNYKKKSIFWCPFPLICCFYNIFLQSILV